MDLGLSHAQSQRLLKQRNLLAGIAILLFASVLLLTILAANRDREVVLQPILPKPLTLTSSGVPADYLEMVTRDAALLTLNRSPSNLQYWMDSILSITDPRTHGKMRAELMKVFNEQNGSSVSQYFTIEKLTVDPKNLTSEVNGIMHTIVGSKEVTAEARTFRFVWSYTGVSLKLAAFGAIQKKDEKEGQS
jgi:conjugal transfer pilus assembly protein TraE